MPEPAPAPAPRRAPAAVNTRLRSSLVLCLLGLAVTAALWAALRYFLVSLEVGSLARALWLVVVVVIGLAGSSVTVFGVLAVRRSLQSAAAVRDGRLSDARIAASRAATWAWYVGGIGATVLLVAFSAWFLATNDAVIRRTFLRGDILVEFMPDIIEAFWLNVKIFMVAEAVVLVWALFVAIGRLFPGRPGLPVRFLATAYADVFRGFPAIITVFLVVFGFQLADLPWIGGWSRETKAFWLPVLALVLVYGAYVAEVYRAGLESVHWSQTSGARSLGLTTPQTLRYVVVPQAVRRIIPPLLNDFIGLQKDTALLSAVGANEAFTIARSASNQVFNPTPVLGAGLCFLVITIPLARFTDWLIKRDQRRMRAGG